MRKINLKPESYFKLKLNKKQIQRIKENSLK